jgi:hypothetical protein
MKKGTVGRSWKSERKTVNVNPHMRKKRGVKTLSSSSRDGTSVMVVTGEPSRELDIDEYGVPLFDSVENSGS